MLNLQHPMTVPADSLFLEIAPDMIAIAETLITTQSSVAAAWTAHDHYLAMETLCAWLQENTQDEVKPWLSDEDCAAVWEVIPGAALNWGAVRLALFTTESMQEEVFSIPQEWVDLPGDFAVDYYLAVKLHLDIVDDDSWLEVCGYATREMLQTQGTYQPEERCYALPESVLVTDLHRLLLSQRLLGQRRGAIAPLPTLDTATQQKILSMVKALDTLDPNTTNADVPDPRTTLPFEQWGAFFTDGAARSQLYSVRMAALKSPQAEPVNVAIQQARPVQPQSPQPNTIPDQPIQLQQWFADLRTGTQQTVNQVWQSVEAIAESFGPLDLTYATRDATVTLPSAVSGLVALLGSHVDPETQYSAIDLLGKFGQGNPTIVNALKRFIQTTSDTYLKREAAVSLGKIDPNHPEAGTRRGKIIDLGVRVGQAPLILVLTLLPEGMKTNLQVQVRGVKRQEVLPENLQLVILDGEQHTLRQERSRSHDQKMQIAFRASAGDEFGVRLALNEHQITEFFTV